MRPSNIVVYGAHWCPDCRTSKQFLGEHQIPYQWVDIEEDKAAEQLVIEKNDGKRIIPTIVFEDGTFLVEPSNAQLAEKLGLKTEASRSHYDVIVLGGGLSEIGALYRLVPAAWGAHANVAKPVTRLVRARFGAESGLRGAAWLTP